MPAEAHRYRWQPGPRDRWLMILAAIATVAVIAGILLDGRSSDASSAPRRCVGVQTAGFMGGVLNEYCGARATALCGSPAGATGDLAAQCARLVPALRPARCRAYRG